MRYFLIVLCLFGILGCKTNRPAPLKFTSSSQYISQTPLYQCEKYQCEKGHISSGIAIVISCDGKIYPANRTCPMCLQEWCQKNLPKVREIK